MIYPIPQVVTILLIALCAYVLHTSKPFQGKAYFYGFFGTYLFTTIVWLVANTLLTYHYISDESFQAFIKLCSIPIALVDFTGWIMLLMFFSKLQLLLKSINSETFKNTPKTNERSSLFETHGFNWFAIIFGPLWAWFHGKYRTGFIMLLGQALIVVFTSLIVVFQNRNVEEPPLLALIVSLVISILWVLFIGFKANLWIDAPHKTKV